MVKNQEEEIFSRDNSVIERKRNVTEAN